ncbi:MAG: HEAT repeat domain-containing protein [Nitriliruptoraceae bacterium]|nr:HEAT repeat domain-containing protein [Nitriliruptoraceae bacterium]
MIRDLLWSAGLALVGLVLLLAIGSLAHAVWVRVREPHRAGRVRAATGALTQLSLGTGTLEGAVEAVAALGIRQQTELFGALGRAVSGQQLATITLVAERVGLTATGERWTQSTNPTRRLRGVRILSNVGAGPSSLSALLQDRSAAVRAESVRLVVNDPTEPGIVRLLGLLADGEPAVAFAAKDALVRCGAATSAVLQRRGATDVAPHTVPDLLDVAVQVAHVAMAPMAAELAAHSDPRVRVGAVRLTAAIGAAASAATLTASLTDDDGAVRAAAAAGIARVGHWPATPQLAACLSDPAWDVRLAAGLSLRRLGAPGMLTLRRALDSPDAFARDMARQVLDLPELRVAS